MSMKSDKSNISPISCIIHLSNRPMYLFLNVLFCLLFPEVRAHGPFCVRIGRQHLLNMNTLQIFVAKLQNSLYEPQGSLSVFDVE